MVQGLEREKEKRVLSIKSGAKLINIKYQDINYVEKVLKRVVVHSNYGIYEFYESIATIEEALGAFFMRVNQGTIVNIEEILYIDKNSIYLKSGELIRIGRTYLNQVKQRWENCIFLCVYYYSESNT